MNLVIPVRKGGLGNQMFQVAAALIYSKETGKQVVLPLEQKHIHKVHPRPYEESIFNGFSTLAYPIDQGVLEILSENGFTVYPGEPGFEQWNPIDVEGNLLLHGYFQYYPPIQQNAELICNTFLKNLEHYKKQSEPNTIAIHVRRGDYLQFQDVFRNLGPSYYIRAICEMEKQVGREKQYKIFSDDIEWCKDQDMFQSIPSVTFIEEKDEIESLCKMIACEGGFICANSTFSWWGAFLGAFQKKSPCIVPQNWMKGFTGDLLPSEWIQIPEPQGSLSCIPQGTLNLHEKKDVENLVKPLKKDIEVYIDTQEYKQSSNYSIFLQMEPVVIKNMENYLIENYRRYNIIYSFNQTILEKCPNAVKAILPACTWISYTHYHNIDKSKKEFQISCITGSKQMAEGHTFRLLLYFNQQVLQQNCKIPIVFYRSSAGQPLPEITKNPFIYKDKFPLFETFQYSLIIENSSQTNYFTEKLIDCLITKTIPIYYGCPNINEYFDTRGWIILEEKIPEARINELVQKWNATQDSYALFSETIEKNYRTCIEKYSGFYNGINKVFLDLPEFS